MREKRTKEKILQAAEELFFLKGYDATGIREIAAKAGVNSSMISYYFGGKRGLYRYLLTTHLGDMLEKVMALPDEDELDFIKSFITVHIGTLRKRGKRLAVLLIRELTAESDIGREVFDRYLRRIGEKVIGVLNRAKGKGLLKSLDTELLFAFLVHTDALFAVRFAELDFEEAVNTAFQLFWSGAGIC
ncbi:TetR/AcrR family transcriptional regulator [Thermosulfidibacter takaii ABI70S6]|uniref:TetR/AcrR family transcriptional regulator n=1 Tax=Thermosulfidibacter takaii (strain DSM 17441 / JCM 13301 / NBRC 103674 / ABI70S6) TaxID=1298851 RepID=A0A0S3QV44_THET7|nr:TetR family transcriptional regulator [Thermosulfidibacter takaii]BAT72170.1 TetR/AcrR family transcriptional regulator [Thermosulfidibacter takaii ABI70S6]